jgi:ABC-2 type transport system ATP-binding protein
MQNIVEIEDLTKDYEVGFWKKRKVRALDGLTLTVEPGQIFGFLGGNGAGKTTTIKMLMSLLFPTSGSAKILGRPISDTAMHSEIGYCPENPYFYDYLTARELMNYFGQIFGLSAEKRKAKSGELLNTVGLDEKDWDKQLRKFSKGMLQRVGLAQSLINEPKIVFLDEPMSGLDPVGRREVREMIAGLKARGTTVFMSTHILSDVEALCENVAILRNGRLSAAGRLDELLATESGAKSYELSFAGVAVDSVTSALSAIAGVEIFEKPNGVAINVDSEQEIEAVLRAMRPTNARLVSVNPVKRSLEELFAGPGEVTAQP